MQGSLGSTVCPIGLGLGLFCEVVQCRFSHLCARANGKRQALLEFHAFHHKMQIALASGRVAVARRKRRLQRYCISSRPRRDATFHDYNNAPTDLWKGASRIVGSLVSSPFALMIAILVNYTTMVCMA